MRVTYLAQVKRGYQCGRGGQGGQLIVQSLAALRNYIQQSDRSSELPLEIKQEGSVGHHVLPSSLPDPQMPATNPNNQPGNRAFIAQKDFITDAIELMQDEEGSGGTILPNGNAGGDSSEGESTYLP